MMSANNCFLCDNTGICLYQKNGYEYAARCICAYGRNPNKFSKSELEINYSPDPNINVNKTVYLPTIKEVLGDDFAIYEAQKKVKKIEKPGVSQEEMLKKLKELNYQFEQVCQMEIPKIL